MEPIVSKKVDKILFGMISPSMIKRMGVVNVVSPEIYDTDGYPVKGGLMDLAMGVIDPGLKCETCGGRLKSCLGHYGSISLAKPVAHILYADHVYICLQSFCKECGRILIAPNKATKWLEKIELAKKEHNLDALRQLRRGAIRMIATTKKCPYCDAAVAKVKIQKPTTFFEGERRIWPNEIRERFEKILDDDLKVLGYDPILARPEWAILTLLLVPPITMRPSITLETGERSEDDLTHKLSDIVRVNQRLLENINAGAPEIIIEDLWDLLQYHITTFFNNKVSQIPPARHRTRRELRTLAQRLAGKEGRFRGNLAGKRVNFCARSVISPDPYIRIDELGVPLDIAKEVTIPEKVTEWNLAWLKKLIENKGVYPSANYIVAPDGKRKRITNETREQILQELALGWVVERHLLDGDDVVFNRQPSLHRISMMGHKVKIVPGRTLRINALSRLSYNADFDGDEMNMHIPQTEEARAEVKEIMTLNKQIITPRYGLAIVGQEQDCLLGLYYLTRDMILSKQEASELLVEADINTELPKPAKTTGSEQYWEGKQIFSLLLPKDLNFTFDGKVWSEGRIVKGKVIIKDGDMTQGVVDKKLVGQEGGALTHKLFGYYSPDIAAEFINKASKLGLAVSKRIAHTLSFYDLDISDESKAAIQKVLEEVYTQADKIVKDYHEDKITTLPGKSRKESFEVKILGLLGKARTQVGEIVEKEVKEDSTLISSARAGVGDSVLNLVLMSGLVGQQVLRGERINSGYFERTLPHFKRGDLGPKAHGFVEHNFVKGLDPVEFFMNAVPGRDSMMDTAMRTPKSGYMQRRLINALQDLKVNYDGTIRDAGQKVIQFNFGGDGIDVSKSDKGSVKV